MGSILVGGSAKKAHHSLEAILKWSLKRGVGSHYMKEVRKGCPGGGEYWFPVVALTNYLKLGDLKPQKYILSQFWRSHV